MPSHPLYKHEQTRMNDLLKSLTTKFGNIFATEKTETQVKE